MRGPSRSIRALTPIAAKYDLIYSGMTSKGHLKWFHTPTGRTLTSIKELGEHRALANAERAFKTRIRHIEEGADRGHDHQD
jgi:hypothetical protein